MMKLMLISGPSCSGKTTFAKKLAEAFPSDQVLVISQDSWFKDLCDIPVRNRAYDMECTGAFHCGEFVDAVTRWMQGRPAFLPEYLVAKNRATGGRFVESRENIIVEGLHAILLLKPLFPDSRAIFLNTPKQICLERRIKRDTTLYSVSAERVTERFLDRILPSYEEYVVRQMQIADEVREGCDIL